MLVMPSHNEGVPIAILEVMAVGLPVIATDVGGIREVVTGNLLDADGEVLDPCGIVIPPRDTVAMTESIERIIRDPDLYEQVLAELDDPTRPHLPHQRHAGAVPRHLRRVPDRRRTPGDRTGSGARRGHRRGSVRRPRAGHTRVDNSPTQRRRGRVGYSRRRGRRQGTAGGHLGGTSFRRRRVDDDEPAPVRHSHTGVGSTGALGRSGRTVRWAPRPRRL